MAKNLYAEVRIVDQLKAGVVPWRQPWSSKGGPVMPRNAITGQGYSGVNVLLLWSITQERGYAKGTSANASTQPKEAKTMTQYHEGQEVEAKRSYLPVIPSQGGWCKAKIVRWIELEAMRMKGMLPNSKGHYEVEFLDGTRGVFDADHIRAVYLGY